MLKHSGRFICRLPQSDASEGWILPNVMVGIILTEISHFEQWQEAITPNKLFFFPLKEELKGLVIADSVHLMD